MCTAGFYLCNKQKQNRWPLETGRARAQLGTGCSAWAERRQSGVAFLAHPAIMKQSPNPNTSWLYKTPLRHTQVLSSLAHWICTPLSPDNRWQEQSVSSERVYVAPSPLWTHSYVCSTDTAVRVLGAQLCPTDAEVRVLGAQLCLTDTVVSMSASDWASVFTCLSLFTGMVPY